MHLAEQLPFPNAHPAGFPALAKEPTFDPARHLALEMPEEIVTLDTLGYLDAEIADCPTRLAITSCFRVLSDEGIACLLEVARALMPYCRSVERISRMVRGGAYQSKFLRDLCLSPDVAATISEICRAPMAPHTMPHQLGHLNYNPLNVGENVDKWHTDTLRIDYVMFVTDPNAVRGGEFEYFLGPKQEAAELARNGQSLPRERVVAPALPGPGYAVLQQGNMVVHRAKSLASEGERITMVNGYVPRDLSYPDYTRFDQLYLADPAAAVSAEYARHVAWMCREMLQGQIDAPLYDEDRAAHTARLETVADMLSTAIANISAAGSAEMEHFGDG